MPPFKRALLGFLAGLSLMTANCGHETWQEASSSTSTTGSGVSSGSPTSNVSGGSVNELQVTNNQATLNIAVEDSQTVTLLLVSLGQNGVSQGFEVTSSESASQLSESAFLQSDFDESPAEDADDLTDSFHDALRSYENHIDDETILPQTDDFRYAVKALQVGDVKSFKVLAEFNSDGAYNNVSAKLIYSGQHFDVFMDERDIGSVTPEDLEAIAQKFDATVPDERLLFGNESDVDSDGRFSILMTHEVNALGQKYGGLVTGYFYATDLFAESSYANSNEMEIIYTLVPDPDGVFGSTVPYDLAIENMLPGVLAHELQHMINFNRHFFLKGTASEAPWLNEGLSHLAEDLYSLDDSIYMPFSGLENPSRISRYLKNIDQVCFTCGSSLQQRGGSYLFLRYLYEQAELGHLPYPENGMHFIELLLSGSYRDIKNITNALSGDPSNIASFEDALSRFGLAVYLSGTGKNQDESLKIEGINLRNIQDDNRGTYLNGPAIIRVENFPYIQTITGHSLTYLQIPGSLINQASSGLRINLSQNGRFRAYLIK